MAWEAVGIGLEVHVQLATNSKIFSGASNEYGAPRMKTLVSRSGLPGALPVLNEKAVEMAVRFGCAISAEINEISIFDRKITLRTCRKDIKLANSKPLQIKEASQLRTKRVLGR